MILLSSLFCILFGFAGGIAVGGGFVAFITVLDIIPRLAQLTKSPSALRYYEWAVITGAVIFTIWDFHNLFIRMTDYILIPLGFVMGIFVGLLAAALTEVINVIPVLAKRLRMQRYLSYLLLAMVVGKVIGSLWQWLFFRVS